MDLVKFDGGDGDPHFLDGEEVRLQTNVVACKKACT